MKYCMKYNFTEDEIIALGVLLQEIPISPGSEVISDILKEASINAYTGEFSRKEGGTGDGV